MATPVIVSYDGTTNDDDALALGRMLAVGGATLSLAYVRHSREYDPRREEIGVYDADRRLEQGALWLEEPEIERHVVIDPSTGAGLAKLAAAEGAQLILFGSDYRTPPGRVEPGGAAQGLLEGSPVAIGVAAAGLRTRADEHDPDRSRWPATPTAPPTRAPRRWRRRSAPTSSSGGGDADLILVDSQSHGPEGQIAPGRAHPRAAGLGARVGHRAAARHGAVRV